MEKGVLLKPGSVFVLPANHTHQIWTTDEEAIIQVQFTGPGNITYIYPADDPRNKVVVGTNAIGASDKQTLNTAGNGPSLLAQEAGPKEAKGSTTAKVNVDSQGVILKGYDAVAYFKQGKPVKGNPEIKSSYQGATYLFASAENKVDFDKDPARYAPQYGGFCAYGVTVGVLSDIEGPDGFVYKDKLYVCGNKDAGKSFMTDLDSNIEKADTNWKKLSGS